MKKFLIYLLLFVPVFAGCAKVETDITINDDKSATVQSVLSYNGNFKLDNNIEAKMLRDNYSKFLDSSYEIKLNLADGYSEIVATKSIKNLIKEDLDLASLGFSPVSEDVNRYIDVKKNFFITSYNIDMLYNYEYKASRLNQDVGEEKSSDILVPEYYHKYGDIDDMEPPVERDDALQTNLDDATRIFTQESYINLKDNEKNELSTDVDAVVRIKVPTFAFYNNADSVNGNVYSWNIDKNEITHIKLQYVQYSSFAIVSILLIGALLLGLLAYRIVRHENQKRADNIRNIV